ncbi:hypothetical protein BT96DRAFT_945363 [Gymnopus androsaceus JB14]|uniref:Uncharacterized protein n=1 Tax=Gymnopus androsaceus JB14 TaxID=1447944 RepID=A0A6A4H221_9AGAR|nr:hypothetical protein BT96DRAFT_945363 [Gymnopus androsaceus JB14]
MTLLMSAKMLTQGKLTTLQHNEERNNDEEEEEAGPEFDLVLGKALEAAKLLELICVNHGDLECLLDLGRNKRRKRSKLELIDSSSRMWNIRHIECKNASPRDIPYEQALGQAFWEGQGDEYRVVGVEVDDEEDKESEVVEVEKDAQDNLSDSDSAGEV